jgi:hypothetical protein
MLTLAAFITASFTEPMRIGVTEQSILWLLPLVASVSIVYKATKITEIQAGRFIKDVVLLFGSIVIFMIITAVVLLGLAWLITE